MIRSIVSLVLILIVMSVASGQNPNGSISGTVEDWFGSVAVDVNLMQNERLVGGTRSNQNGEYVLSHLPLGVYDVQVMWSLKRIISKRVELTSSHPVQKNVNFSNKPCSGESDNTKDTPISDSDKAEIVKELVNLEFRKQVKEKITFVPRNIDVAWLSSEQKVKLNIMTRDAVQTVADKSNDHQYYWISPIKQSGGCIVVSMDNGWAVKGQVEDANMAGGGMIYEFKKIAGRWVGQAIGGWIS